MDENKYIDTYIAYRIEKSKEAFTDACVLADHGSWNATVNRLYYASYYAVSALLLRNNIKAQSHAGVKSEFGKHFVKTGLLPKELFRLYSDLMDWRQKGDYGDMFDFDKSSVAPMLPFVEQFIGQIVKLIETNN